LWFEGVWRAGCLEEGWTASSCSGTCRWRSSLRCRLARRRISGSPGEPAAQAPPRLGRRPLHAAEHNPLDAAAVVTPDDDEVGIPALGLMHDRQPGAARRIDTGSARPSPRTAERAVWPTRGPAHLHSRPRVEKSTSAPASRASVSASRTARAAESVSSTPTTILRYMALMAAQGGCQTQPSKTRCSTVWSRGSPLHPPVSHGAPLSLRNHPARTGGLLHAMGSMPTVHEEGLRYFAHALNLTARGRTQVVRSCASSLSRVQPRSALLRGLREEGLH
jgi:hypothetical protein